MKLMAHLMRVSPGIPSCLACPRLVERSLRGKSWHGHLIAPDGVVPDYPDDFCGEAAAEYIFHLPDSSWSLIRSQPGAGRISGGAFGSHGTWQAS